MAGLSSFFPPEQRNLARKWCSTCSCVNASCEGLATCNSAEISCFNGHHEANALAGNPCEVLSASQ
jgi:hypothetical protein